MSKKKTPKARNFVAKHMHETTKSQRHRDKKNDYSRKEKHKDRKDPYSLSAL